MEHPQGFAFNQPVVPVKLIPDYLIIEPMNLVTIKCKLEDKTYFYEEEFASDVSLTFPSAI